jgi:excisionase family DNA binding protein
MLGDTIMAALAPVRNLPPVAPITISKARVATSLGVSIRTVHALIASGELAAIRVGGRVLVPVAALEAFVASCPPVVAK